MTGQTDMEKVIQRLQRVEREIYWWRIAALLILLSAAMFLFAGGATTAPTVIEAQRFVLRGSDNKVRAVLGTELPGLRSSPTDVGGSYGLHFYDSDGAYRAGISSYGFHFFDSDGAYRAGISKSLGFLGTGEADDWELLLQDKKTPSSASLLVSDGSALLVLNATEESREVAERKDEERRKKFNAAKTPEERKKLVLGEKRDRVKISLSAFPKGTSSLGLEHGLGGGLEFSLLGRQSSLWLKDENNTTRVVLGYTEIDRTATSIIEKRPVSSVVLFDKEAKVVWKAP